MKRHFITIDYCDFMAKLIFGVGANSTLCSLCDLWVHKKCSAKTDDLTDKKFFCHKCSGEIVPATIAYVKEINIRNDNFPVKFTVKYLGYTIGQCGSCSYAVSTCTVS